MPSSVSELIAYAEDAIGWRGVMGPSVKTAQPFEAQVALAGVGSSTSRYRGKAPENKLGESAVRSPNWILNKPFWITIRLSDAPKTRFSVHFSEPALSAS